ncbi:acyltransferase [Nakamurella flavida]|uniref:Acyltransferase n=2 Tax=Nakamurella flavida TaxID=363630 RepID=A0A938YI40_9ACTN|nr:acyltransferase [Nakamurella flavida]
MPTTTRRFRADIEGLRAVAVLLVVLFHAGVTQLPGGFVGVDVFFVISGYLITGHLLDELTRHGRISFARFYARRARRLLPVACVVVMATVALYALTTSALQTRQISVDALWTLGFAMNLRLAITGVDYQADQDPSPFTHYWSLAVEEQFYLVVPLLLLGAYLLAARVVRTERGRRLAMVLALTAVAAVSFTWTLGQMRTAPAQSYFLLPTRAWELAVGGVVAAATPWLVRLRWLSTGALALLGLAAIGAAAVLYSASTGFPGAPALLPVLGAAAVIAGGLGAPHVVQRFFLGLRPMQTLGRLSYGWYLWHWGPLVLCATLLERDLTPGEGLTLAGLTLVLAALTSVLVETPFRTGVTFARSSGNGLLVGVFFLVISVTATLTVLRTSDAVTGDPGVRADQVAIADGAVDVSGFAVVGPVPGNLQPPLDRAGKDAPDLAAADGQSCHARIVSAELSEDGTGSCVAGGTEAGSRTVMLVGDSHAHQWLPALQELAAADDWRLINLTKGACPLYDVTLVNNQLGRDYTECYAWREKVWARIDAERPDLIVTSAAIFSEREGDFTERWSAGVHSTLTRLRATGADVVTIADTPFPRRNIPKCLAGHLDDAGSCAFSPTTGQSDPARRAATTADAVAAGVTVVDPTPWFCDAARCPAVIGNTLVYRDNSHISTVYSRQIAPLLGAQLPAP